MKTLRVLLIEDSPADARLIQEMLREESEFHLDVAESLLGGLERIGANGADAVLLDLGLPDSEGLDGLKKISEKNSDIPVIVLTGLDDRETGIRAVQMGAQDYLIKGIINPALLCRSILYAIERKKLFDEREKLIAELQEALANIKTLRGLLPICAWCKKIRDEKGYWQKVEHYLEQHSEAHFTHGICNECLKKVGKEFFEQEKKGK